MQSLFAAIRTCRRRQLQRRSVIGQTTMPAGASPRNPMRDRGRDEAGFLLIEVLMSAFLVALIVIATFNGFDAVGASTADQRRHSEAQLLAAESEEQLRTDSATALDALESAPHVYTREVGGTLFTVTQEANPVNAKATGTGCSGTETTKENGANIRIASSVTWASLTAEKRPAVRAASIITPPTGSALEVDVTNGGSSGSGVSGVTATAKFLPTGSGTFHTVEGTTGSAGCVVFTGLDTTLATVEIKELSNYVTEAGKPSYPSKEVSIAPNITTQDPVAYDKGGRITAKFTYKGAQEWEGKVVKGDTFVVSSSEIPAGYPTFEVGSTSLEYQGTGEEQYRPYTSSYAATATTATATKYLYGDLFPFPEAWSVYAGDCPADKVSSEAEASGGAVVTAGNATEISVPMSRTEVSLWTGSSSSSKGSAVSEHLGPVYITNKSCKSAETPDNATGAAYDKGTGESYVAEQAQTSTAGHLEDPFQPFGEYSLCLVDKTTDKTYTVSYTNSTVSGTAPQIYVTQRTEAEDTKINGEETTAKEKREKETSEAQTAKEKREKEETEAKTAKEKREKEETEAKTAKEKREKTEKEEREKWEKEEKEKKITKAQKTTKESEQKTKRESSEKTEKTAKEKRASEEATAKAAKEKREKEETEAKAPREKREKEETEAKAAKESREKEETTEKASGVTVASGEKC